MMGKLLTHHRCMQILLLAIIAGTGFFLPVSTARAADQCTIQGGSLFPSNLKWISQFGDRRGTGHRKHTGLDMGYPAGQAVPQPPGCEILLNSAGGYRFNNRNQPIDNGAGKIIGSDRGGYGVQLFYKCGAPGGDQITLRYSHVPKKPLTNDGRILQGSTGNARGGRSGPHYHFEMVIGNRPIDPECAMLGHKPAYGKTNIDGAKAVCRSCPAGLPAGAQDLCNKSVRDKLIQHGKTCTTASAHPNGQTRNVPGGKSIDPSRLGETDGQPDENENENSTDSPNADGDGGGEDHGHDEPNDAATSGGGFTGNPDDFYPPSPTGPTDPPITPPDPDTPGTPGGNANLTPEPDKSPEELSGCGTDTWTAMVNQGVMEARREDALNKRYIIKSDSVLDYGCFSLYVKKTADNAGPIFSETKKWANLPVDILGKIVVVKRELGSKSLDGALMDIVQAPLTNYRRGQFNNPFLAETASAGSPSGGTNCDVMSRVWKAAKCKNFDGTDVFYTFDDLKAKEPREFPSNMKCGNR